MDRFLSLEFSSEIIFLELVDFAVETFLRNVDLDERVFFRVSFSVRECVINAIKHGNGFQKDKKVSVEFYLKDEKIFKCIIKDMGKGFNIEEISDPSQGENLLRPDGRGLFLVKTFMDETFTKKVNDHFEVIIVKNLK